ncbi:NifU family protein [Mycolicibacterium stellerae]|uniref:NifU family protein n=1 Tax=Mycolicibacterium stellerae TaxID=2358193 RepID=UPI000F0B7446|nr:NifU family protein [Mycolicibacterium stellerae]
MSKPSVRTLDDALRVIRPRLRGHAGDMRAELDDDGTVHVQFDGVCQTCPSIAVTYAGLVRTTLLEVPGVRRVVADQVHASARTLDRIAGMLGARRVDNQ